jgi:hypothetical protein
MPARVRNVIGPVYALLIVVGFIISPAVGVIVAIVGAALTGILWSMLSGRTAEPGLAPTERAAARAARRAGRG